MHSSSEWRVGSLLHKPLAHRTGSPSSPDLSLPSPSRTSSYGRSAASPSAVSPSHVWLDGPSGGGTPSPGRHGASPSRSRGPHPHSSRSAASPHTSLPYAAPVVSPLPLPRRSDMVTVVGGGNTDNCWVLPIVPRAVVLQTQAFQIDSDSNSGSEGDSDDGAASTGMTSLSRRVARRAARGSGSSESPTVAKRVSSARSTRVPALRVQSSESREHNQAALAAQAAEKAAAEKAAAEKAAAEKATTEKAAAETAAAERAAAEKAAAEKAAAEKAAAERAAAEKAAAERAAAEKAAAEKAAAEKAAAEKAAAEKAAAEKAAAEKAAAERAAEQERQERRRIAIAVLRREEIVVEERLVSAPESLPPVDVIAGGGLRPGEEEVVVVVTANPLLTMRVREQPSLVAFAALRLAVNTHNVSLFSRNDIVVGSWRS